MNRIACTTYRKRVFRKREEFFFPSSSEEKRNTFITIIRQDVENERIGTNWPIFPIPNTDSVREFQTDVRGTQPLAERETSNGTRERRERRRRRRRRQTRRRQPSWRRDVHEKCLDLLDERS